MFESGLRHQKYSMTFRKSPIIPLESMLAAIFYLESS
ncbi:Uncharacterised protein [Enterobacter hormaechei]|nr:Uncharacterised protein [Enterobacter hormaechei]